jgi:tRNA U34 5-methylaminomethyl-2-thiouridine-forming methyltransferase MnmC
LRYGDSYYSRTDGRAETAHVFLAGNGLPGRWSAGGNFTIAELGFGTGLNFLETLRQWRLYAPPGSGLDYISFELHPLDPGTMRRAVARLPELDESAEELKLQWSNSWELQRLEFDANVTLTVFACDAGERLPRLEFMADAWYLDGFSPARNPQLWSLPLMQAVFAHTRPGGGFATYSSAGWVRRNLEAAGFEIERIAGFGDKRQMTRGIRPLA